MKDKIKICVIILLLVIGESWTAGQKVLPSHKCIQFTGRVCQVDSSTVMFDWPSIQIKTAFTGTSCRVYLSGGNEGFDIYLNGCLSKTIRLNEYDSCYLVAEKLKDTLHHLTITKRFASWGNPTVFKGLIIDENASLQAPDMSEKMRIQLIGGSILSGFGNQSCCIDCESIVDSSNSSLSFGALLANKLNADYHLISVSGKGLVREWGSPFLSISDPFGSYYDRVLRAKPTPEWDYALWKPNLVIINLGGNDFSTRPHPVKGHFISVYRALVRTIISRYPNCSIVCITSHKEPLRSFAQEAVCSLNEEGLRNVVFFSYAPVPFSLRGCDWHPNIAAHEQIADQLHVFLRENYPEFLRVNKSIW